MKRFYSHYTFIYPDIYLKNCIVEVDDTNRIVGYFNFEKEIEKTEFHSGWLYFIPIDISIGDVYLQHIAENKNNNSQKNILTLDSLYKIYNQDYLLIS